MARQARQVFDSIEGFGRLLIDGSVWLGSRESDLPEIDGVGVSGRCQNMRVRPVSVDTAFLHGNGIQRGVFPLVAFAVP